MYFVKYFTSVDYFCHMAIICYHSNSTTLFSVQIWLHHFIRIPHCVANLELFVGYSQYLRLARELAGYGDLVFPHCSCDSRKEGHVIASVGAASFKLQACREDGALEVM